MSQVPRLFVRLVTSAAVASAVSRSLLNRCITVGASVRLAEPAVCCLGSGGECVDAPPARLSIYSAAKAGVIGLTKSAGEELATTGVLVNAIAPAVIATPMNKDTAPDVLAHITSLITMRRVGRPEEVAELVAYLCSDRLSFSTGAVYDISGGRATYSYRRTPARH
jgi:NAD(P)-dependent dehydrogenase (short-subunit alcohol dehydrogenase family)